MSKIWTPTDSDREWMRRLINLLKDGGTWMVPATGQVFTKKGDSLVWTNEEVGDESEVYQRSKIIANEMGIDVYKQSEL